MTKKILISSIVLFGGIFLFVVGWYMGPSTVLGSAPSGSFTTLATSSTQSVGSTSAVTIFTQVDYADKCHSRVIGTGKSPINISFGSTTPTGAIGFVQAASTTVAYDAAIYGCGMWQAWGQEAAPGTPSSTIFKAQF